MIAARDLAVPPGSGYTLARYDDGRTVSVHPSIMGQIDESGAYAVSMTDVDGSVHAYPTFRSLPAPKQVRDLVASGRSSGTTKGTNITLDPNALK